MIHNRWHHMKYAKLISTPAINVNNQCINNVSSVPMMSGDICHTHWTQYRRGWRYYIGGDILVATLSHRSPVSRIVLKKNMMTSSNGNIFCISGLLCGEFTGHRWIPPQRPVARSFDVFFDLRLNKRSSNNRDAGDRRRHRAHYDVTLPPNIDTTPQWVLWHVTVRVRVRNFISSWYSKNK